MEEVKNSLKSRVVTISLVLILAAVIVVLFYLQNRKQKLPDINSVEDITIQYEFQEGEVRISDKEGFYNALKYNEWVKAEGYEKKFAAVGYVTFFPNKNSMEILGKDSEGSFIKIESTVYLAPADVYDYLISFRGE